jgi:hypothetical protein
MKTMRLRRDRGGADRGFSVAPVGSEFSCRLTRNINVLTIILYIFSVMHAMEWQNRRRTFRYEPNQHGDTALVPPLLR